MNPTAAVPSQHAADSARSGLLAIDALLERAVELGASDLHITAGSLPVVRVHGHIEALDDFPELDPEATRQLLYRITTTEQQKQLELNRQLDFAYGVRGLGRFRVGAYYQRESLAAAFRMIPTDIRSIEELGLPPSLHEFTTKPRGLVLFTGPTGSGKSTSLAALIDEINDARRDHIITIEDPIEFLHQHKRCIVNQREIGGDAVGFLREGGKDVGKSEVMCINENPNVGRCHGTLRLAGGSLEASGGVHYGGRFSLPVVGGTRAYLGARGVLTVIAVDGKRSRYAIELAE